MGLGSRLRGRSGSSARRCRRGRSPSESWPCDMDTRAPEVMFGVAPRCPAWPPPLGCGCTRAPRAGARALGRVLVARSGGPQGVGRRRLSGHGKDVSTLEASNSPERQTMFAEAPAVWEVLMEESLACDIALPHMDARVQSLTRWLRTPRFAIASRISRTVGGCTHGGTGLGMDQRRSGHLLPRRCGR